MNQIGMVVKGETFLIALMPSGGHNQEDAIVLSKGAAKRGLFSSRISELLVKPDEKITGSPK